MSLRLITVKIIHPMCSFLFGVIFFGAAAIGILTGQVLSVCEDVPSPNNIASLLHINTIPQLDVWKELVYDKCVNIPYLFVTLPGLSRRISSLVGLRGVLGSADAAFVTFFLGCLRFLQVIK